MLAFEMAHASDATARLDELLARMRHRAARRRDAREAATE
jgi:hypothetical protein